VAGNGIATPDRDVSSTAGLSKVFLVIADIDLEANMRAKRMTDVEFCRRCLEIVDEVHRTRRPIVVTRDIAMVLPAGKEPAAPKPSSAKNR
jgi:hypothetical protein